MFRVKLIRMKIDSLFCVCFNLERIDHSRLVRMRKHSFMTAMRHDAFFSPAYLVARAATSVKALRPKTRDTLIRKDTAESCVETRAFPAVIEDVHGKRSGTYAFNTIYRSII